MYLLSIDQGTTGTTTVLYDRRGMVASRAYRELSQIYPRPGWVEHDPMEIWQTVVDTAGEIAARHPGRIAAIGIANQRETTLLWDRKTGAPVYNAIVWQCRRTADDCERLAGYEPLFRRKTGLPLDPYFSGTKIKWILENVMAGRREGSILFGTIDSWLVWNLTGGKLHATDYTNASRTLLFDIHEKRWDKDLCQLFGVPLGILPHVKKSIDDYGVAESIPCLAGIPIFSVAGDQQAALFGQTCFEKGHIKNTYGTGCFVVMNTGSEAIDSKMGLITTLAVDGQGQPCYAVEGPVFVAGAAIQWLRDELEILESASDSEAVARSIDDTNGVYLVPAFVGLGAPHWDMDARGVIVGLTRGTNRKHIIRAALEAMAYQTYDVLSAMEKETQSRSESLAVDGGASANDFLMQFQADIIGKPVIRPTVLESTSLGAAFMAGLKAGTWRDHRELIRLKTYEREFHPTMKEGKRRKLLDGWRKALRQTRVR